MARILNERLAGLTLSRIRQSIGERLRDAGRPVEESELLNIFVAEREEIFDLSDDTGSVVLGSAQERAAFAALPGYGELREVREGGVVTLDDADSAAVTAGTVVSLPSVLATVPKRAW